ncbi:MAG: SDR family NAD(P)-dependent oxidoreductase [Desulfobacterales bacterium]|jgi:3-oxoacyl-[acyl-carrier protein] reductase/2-[hydroxy(phenyl)methyl]-succinyl-CoA dehydrogenase BbsC subunit|nr:SDR family NAD(P)-dependent oxidoreductase [Desulfobacterales bacterium]
MQNTSNEVVLINGVSDEVGQSIGLSFGGKGASVVIAGSDKASVDQTVAQIKEAKGEAIGCVVNPSNEGEVKAAVKKAVDTYGKLDVLVNNIAVKANVLQGKKTTDLTQADWNKTVTSGTDPLFLFCREAVSVMREKKYGRIINIGSLYYLGWPKVASLSAANAAIYGFTRALALETAIDNITVNSIGVGDLADAGLSEEETAKLKGSIPMARLGKPEDIDNAVEFFASRSAKYITGQTLFVCGGKCIHFSMSI